MPNVVVALMVFVPCVVAGAGVTYLCGVPLRLEERLAVGVPVGALLVAGCGWMLATLVGLDRTTVMASLIVALAISALGWRRGRSLIGDEARDLVRRLRLPVRDPESLRPLVALLALAWPITVRIFALAWVTVDGGLSAGHLATFSDGSAHLAYAGIMTGEGTIPPPSPIAAGEAARYHLLADFFSAQVSLLGIALPSALALTSGFLALAFPAVMYLCGVRLVASRAIAAVAVVVFCGGGGLGFVHLMGDITDQGWSALVHLPRSYSRNPDASIWMDNPALSYLHAQRNGLLGFPSALAAVTLVVEGLRGSERTRRSCFLAAGILIGMVPIASGFAWTITLAIAAVWALVDAGRHWLRFFVPALLLGGPVAWWLQPDSSAARIDLGWMSDGGVFGWLAFWAVNAGPFIVLLVVAHLWRSTVPRPVLVGFAPFWLLWLIPNVIAFHPWEWNNTKYFAFWQLFGSFLVAAVVVRVARHGSWGRIGAAGLLVLLCASGALDLYRATDRTATVTPWATDDGLAVAEWIRSHTPDGTVVATATTVYNPVTALGGRAILSGHPGWTWDLGIPDWQQRVDDTATILRGGETATEAAERRGVDLAVIGPLERGEIDGIDEAWWESKATVAYRVGEWTVFEVP